MDTSMDTSPDVYADLAEASQILGLSQEAIRKRLHRGTLQGCKVDGRWMVRLPTGRLDADRDDPDACQDARQDVAGRLAGRPDDGTWTASGCPDERQDARDALLERLYRDNLELAGRCGFLQARVQDLEREVQLLRAPSGELRQMPDPDLAPTSNPPAPTANGHDLGTECPPRPPWWKFWTKFMVLFV